MFQALHDQAERVPFDVPLILFGVVREEDAILVDLDENGADFEDNGLEPDYLGQRFYGTYGLHVSLSGVCPCKWLQSLQIFILALEGTLIDSCHLLTHIII